MLEIIVDGFEIYDEQNNRFIELKNKTKLSLEHSLLSISKWEQKVHKPFLEKFKKDAKEPVTASELQFYIKCMTVNAVDPNVYYGITSTQMKMIMDYINDPATATWFAESENKKFGDRKILTNEVIYSYLVALQIPFRPVETWHINRTLTLIRVCNEQNNPKKMTKRDTVSRYAALNAQRRAKSGSKG